MKYFHGFLLLLITAYDILESVQAQNQSEFISLACGLIPEHATYTEKSTNQMQITSIPDWSGGSVMSTKCYSNRLGP
ncbi:hypothetical protein BRARA_E01606 [Brassica rapa]|uniref:Uncharacterized protein n=1 Tax=Brassica campestris TaxID=3711 RepID=A0A397ZGM3_BRACM|nr:hypothetical protein BRARA_E01606 [Brassica rapa]CAG7875501.1 unnamed protein product [Brassica rapa]